MNTSAVDDSCDIRVLGALRAAVRGQPVALPRSRKARALLAYLAVAGESGVHREDLCRLLFADTNDPRGSLRWSVSRLRAALGDDSKDLLITDGDRLKLASHCRLDLDRLDYLIASGRVERRSSTVWLADLIAFEQALEGGFLDGLELPGNPEFETWRLALHSRCSEQHAELLRIIIRGLRGERRAIEYARRLINIDPTSESAWAELVHLLRLNGHLEDARRTHELAQRQLIRDGVPLSGRLREAISLGAYAVGAQQPASPIMDRTSVLVLECESGADIDHHIARQVSAGVAAAASRCKACRMRIPMLAGAASDKDSLVDVNTAAWSTEQVDSAKHTERDSDLVLHSALHGVAGGFEVHANLRRADSGESIFSWQLTIDPDDPRTPVEQVTRYFASHFEIDLIIAQIGVAREKPEQIRSARDSYHLALPLIYSAEGIRTDEALAALDNVLKQSADLAPALCATGWVRSVHPQFNANPEELRKTSAMVRKAVEIGQDDPFVLGFAAVVISHSDLDVATSEDLVTRALALNPESPLALIAGGYTAHYQGDFALSMRRIDTIIELDATGPLTFFAYTCRAMSLYQLDALEEAELWSRRALGHNPTFIVSLRILAATLARRGALAEARQIVQRMLELDVSETLEFFRARSPYQTAAAKNRLCADLEAAGMPERLAASEQRQRR